MQSIEVEFRLACRIKFRSKRQQLRVNATHQINSNFSLKHRHRDGGSEKYETTFFRNKQERLYVCSDVSLTLIHIRNFVILSDIR